MKRISLILIVIAVTIIGAAGVNVHMSTNNKYVSPLTLKNIEALAEPTESLETTDSCGTLGTTYGGRRAQSGSACSCKGRTIYPQTCVSSGNGCTVIKPCQ